MYDIIYDLTYDLTYDDIMWRQLTIVSDQSHNFANKCVSIPLVAQSSGLMLYCASWSGTGGMPLRRASQIWKEKWTQAETGNSMCIHPEQESLGNGRTLRLGIGRTDARWATVEVSADQEVRRIFSGLDVPGSVV